MAANHVQSLDPRSAADLSLRRLSNILESITDAFYALDFEGRFIYLNQKAEAFFKQPRGALIGKPIWRVCPDAVGLGFYNEYNKALFPTMSVRVEEYYPPMDAWFEVFGYPSAEGVSIYFRNITQRKRAAEDEKLRALGQLAGGVAHDLNQYLGLVVGHGELALHELDERDPDFDALRESLQVIVRAALDGAETVRGLQTFARSRPEGPAEVVDLGELLREVAKLTAPRWRDAARAEGRPIELEIEVVEAPSIAGWAASLREALTNLVLNAVDALPRGGRIRLAARRRTELVEIEVSDSGVGMTPEVRTRLFEPFFTTKPQGTGLGLAMVFGIVERHHGRIEVVSAPGRGATFCLRFPLAPAGAAQPAPSARVAPARPPRRVLVVDDEPALAKLLSTMLETAGHAVVLATSGEEALDRLAAEAFDLVISDVGLGEGMNGWRLADEVRTRHPGLPFALATGWGGQIDPEQAHQHGIMAVLGKPYRLADLLSLVDTLDTPHA